MASTSGRKAKLLPQILVDGFAQMGYRRMSVDMLGVPLYRHLKHPTLFCSVVVGNLPGSDAVVADWRGHPPTRLSPDDLLAALAAQLHVLESPVRNTNPTARGRYEEQSSD